MTSAGLKEPVQKRSQASLDRLLKAGARLLEERGYAGFTIPELSRRAKVSAGLIYGRFENKDAILRAIQDRELDRTAREFDEITDPARWDGLPLASLLEGLIPETAGLLDQHAKLFNVFVARGAVDDSVRARGAVFMTGLNQRLRDLLLTRRDEISRPDPERAAAMACELMVAAFIRRAGGGPPAAEPPPRLSWDEVVGELPVVCWAYLSS